MPNATTDVSSSLRTWYAIQYIRDGQTFFLKGQIWRFSFWRGPQKLKTCVAEIFRLFVPFFDHFWWLLREKSVIFWKFYYYFDFLQCFFQMTNGPRAAKTSWRAACGQQAALWPPLLNTSLIVPRVSKIVAYIVKNINTIFFEGLVSWLHFSHVDI